MTTLWAGLKRRAAGFATNWSGSDEPFRAKVAMLAKNRAKALRHGCCGNHGQPGC
jgi:hypothetical protein